MTKVKWNEGCIRAVKPKVWHSCPTLQNKTKKKTKNSKLYRKAKRISTSDESFFLCHVWCCRSCVKTGAITVHPQGAGHDGEIWPVSAATESTTPQCKHGACAGTALTLQPKDTALSQVLNRRQRVGDRAAGAIVCKYRRQHEKEKETWRTKPHLFFLICLHRRQKRQIIIGQHMPLPCKQHIV